MAKKAKAGSKAGARGAKRKGDNEKMGSAAALKASPRPNRVKGK